MEQVKQNIRQAFDSLTAGQKKVARYVLDNPSRIAMHAVKEIGVRTETSEATVIRFCVAVGYSGYSELQEEIRAALLHRRSSEHPIRKLGQVSTEEPQDAGQYIEYVLQQNKLHIEQTMTVLDPVTLEKAVERLSEAKHIAVIGLRASYAPAHWLTYSLNVLLGNAVQYRGSMDDGNYLLSMMDEGWVVIALSFPRYMKETLEFSTEAKGRGAHLIAITDHELSPIALLADQLFKVAGQVPAALRGMPSVFALLNTLVGYLAVKDRKRVERRLEEYDSFGRRSYYYVEDGDVT